jgi:predicted metallo-beta-lactamase superfamily hydrolase
MLKSPNKNVLHPIVLNNMPSKIRVIPLAAESLGTRSMCTFIETKDVKVALDAGVSLAPNRFGLAPHPKEYDAILKSRKRIEEKASEADVVTISHYHFDHHTPSFIDWVCNWSSPEIAQKIYENKLVLLKNPKANINFSQRRRGWVFAKTGGKYAKKLQVADGKVFEFGDTLLKFSEPVFHGSEDTSLGWVLTTTIEHEDERIMFAPDVQGPMYGEALKLISAVKPQLLIIGGPPLYLAGFRVAETQLQKGLESLAQLVSTVPLVILEHHLLRTENWREQAKVVFDAAQKNGHKVVTAAEFLGKKDNLLEARRKQLFETEPPGKGFMKWTKISLQARKLVKPPI